MLYPYTYNQADYIKELLINELKNISPDMAEQVFGFVQVLKKSKKTKVPISNINEILQLAGSIDKQSGDDMMNIIESEFQSIEGEW